MNPVLTWMSRTLGRHGPATSATPGPHRAAPALCPRCHGHARRVPRRFADRLLSWVVPVHRYRCQAIGCSWEGRRVVGRHHANLQQRIYDGRDTVLQPSRLSDSAPPPVSGRMPTPPPSAPGRSPR